MRLCERQQRVYNFSVEQRRVRRNGLCIRAIRVHPTSIIDLPPPHIPRTECGVETACTTLLNVRCNTLQHAATPLRLLILASNTWSKIEMYLNQCMKEPTLSPPTTCQTLAVRPCDGSYCSSPPTKEEKNIPSLSLALSLSTHTHTYTQERERESERERPELSLSLHLSLLDEYVMYMYTHTHTYWLTQT